MPRIKETSWERNSTRIDMLYSRAGVGTQIRIEGDGKAILIDIGDGTLRDLLEKQYDPAQLAGILITHGHFDHLGGLHTLLGYLRMLNRTEPLKIIYPQGSLEPVKVIETFRICYPDTPFEIEMIAAVDRSTFELGGFRVEALEVVHHGSTRSARIGPRLPALGYRIIFDDLVIAVSGDTGLCDNLAELVKDADLALIEATYDYRNKIDPDMLEKVHLTKNIAEKIGASAKDYILYHRIVRN